MPSFNIEDRDKYLVMNLVGDYVAMEDIELFREKLKELAKGKNNKVILNLKEVSYLNSTALGVLLSANALFEKNNGKLLICNVNEYLRNIFSITKLTFIFTLYSSIEDAAKKLF